MFRLKRVYDEASPKDGLRVLVERLWPRGLSKERAEIGLWHKDIAPSADLRKWFGHRQERWEEFRRRYRSELDANPAAWQPLLDNRGTLTLLYSAHDTEHNGALVLRDYLLEHATGRAGRID